VVKIRIIRAGSPVTPGGPKTTKYKITFSKRGTVLGWEFDLSIELLLIQSLAPAFDPGLVKKQRQAPNLCQKMPVMHLIKRVPLPSLMKAINFYRNKL